MIPIYIFYSMFGFQRTGDGLWAAADQMARGFILGATAGRTTLTGEGLQHNDGHSLLLAATNPAVLAYDPAWSFEIAHIVRDGLRRMYGEQAEDIFYYLTIYNEPYVQAPGAGRPRRRGPAARAVPVPGGAGGQRPAGADPHLRRGDAVGAAGGRAAARRVERAGRGVVGDVLVGAAPRRRRDRPAQLPAPGGGGAAAVRDAGAVRRLRARWSPRRTGCARCRT